MKEFKLRDLETGAVLTRKGANVVEMLRMCRVEGHDEEGRALLDDDGNVRYTSEPRFAEVGKEPKGWRAPPLPEPKEQRVAARK